MNKTGPGNFNSEETGRSSRRKAILTTIAALGWQLLGSRPSFANSKELKMDNVVYAGSTANPKNHHTLDSEPGGVGMAMTLDQLVIRLKRAGELVISGEDQAEADSYFDTANYRFHGPDGFDVGYSGIANYFKAIREAFDDRSIRRGIIVGQGNHIACQTWIEGKFVREFTQSPAGALPPNGKRVVWDLINIFRFDGQGRLVEEWVQTDYRSFLRQLGAPGK